MKYTLQNITHFEFFEQLKDFDDAIDRLIKDKVEDDQKFISSSILIIKEIEVFIIEKIAQDAKHLIALFSQLDSDIYSRLDRYGRTPFENEKSRLERFSGNFKLAIGYLSVTESLLNPEVKIYIDNIPEKIDFLLSKLNKLFDDNYYSISEILKLNNISFRGSEPTEMADDLVRRGYVKASDRWRYNDRVQLTVKGSNYIDRKNKQKKNSKSSIELEKKIDEIIQHLTKLGFGQEIIFNEIEELRELQHKLSKKTWAQLLKGKLFDLAVESVISKETATFIYEYLTSGHFKLLDFK